MAQQPTPQPFQNYGYMQNQQQFPAAAPPTPQNGQHPNLVNGFSSPPQLTSPNMNPMKPITTQQHVPPPVNYNNFQTNALHNNAMNGGNSALSSRTSSPGVQSSNVPSSQLPPSKSYPSYQHLHGSAAAAPQYLNAQQPPSQFPMAPPGMTNINTINNNNGEGQQLPSHPSAPLQNPPTQQVPSSQANVMGIQQQQQQPLSASMKNLTLNNSVPNYPSPMPSSKSDQNLLNNNNTNNSSAVTAKPLNMQKRPMYPQQSAVPMAQAPMMMNQPTQFQQTNQNQQFSSFPGAQSNQLQQQQQQQPQQAPRGNLQFQNLQQQQPTAAQQYPTGNIVHQGFNQMWGRETIDLMQNRHVLPQSKVAPPQVKLNHQFHEATNCNLDIFRCTLTKIPESNSLLQKSRLPLGILIHPYRDLSVRQLRFSLQKYLFPSFLSVTLLESPRYQLFHDCSLSSVPYLYQPIRLFRR
jgi:protein transport protein SEC24